VDFTNEAVVRNSVGARRTVLEEVVHRTALHKEPEKTYRMACRTVPVEVTHRTALLHREEAGRIAVVVAAAGVDGGDA